MQTTTSVNSNTQGDSYINNRFAMTGGKSVGKSLGLDFEKKAGLVDDLFGNGIPNKLLEVTFSGGPNLPVVDLNPTTIEGIIFEDNDGFVIGADEIMRLKPSTEGTGAGATILTPFIPGSVTLIMQDSGETIVRVLVTDGQDPPDTETESLEFTISGTNPILKQIPGGDFGISKIEIVELLTNDDPPVLRTGPTATLGVSVVKSTSLEQAIINEFDFTDTDIQSITPYDTLTFDAGLWFTEGKMQATKDNKIKHTVEFKDADDPDYLISTNPSLSLPANEKEFSVFSSSLGGFTNTGEATIKPDLDQGITAVLCNPADDIEKDGLCDTDEARNGGDGGIKYRQFGVNEFLPFNAPCPSCAGVNEMLGSNFNHPTRMANLLDEEKVLTGQENANNLSPTVGIRDVYLEIDAMEDHPVDIKAINDVIRLYADAWPSPEIISGAIADEGIALHVFIDQGRLIAKFVDGGSAGFDSGEPLYFDVDDNDVVSAGDIRLLNTIDDDSTVLGGDSDVTTTTNLATITTPAVSDDGAIPHKNIITVWRDRDFNFLDDYNMIKYVNYGTKNLISPGLSISSSTAKSTQVNQVQVVDAAAGEYNLIISGLTITTPEDPRTSPNDKMKGTFHTKVTVQTENLGGKSPTFAKGNSGVCTSNNPCVTDTAELEYGGETTDGFSRVSTGRVVKVTMVFNAQEQLIGFPVAPITVPFTISNPAKHPLGCDNDPPSAALSFCNPGITKAEYPNIDSKMKTEAYSQVYRYNENVHSFGGPSGEAELRGNDYITALGGFGIAWNGHQGGTRHEQSGTQAHELLHLFGGLHGGPEWLIYDTFQEPLADTVENCKPYPGVDKYSGQLGGTYLTLLTDSFNCRSHFRFAYWRSTR